MSPAVNCRAEQRGEASCGMGAPPITLSAAKPAFAGLPPASCRSPRCINLRAAGHNQSPLGGRGEAL